LEGEKERVREGGEGRGTRDNRTRDGTPKGDLRNPGVNSADSARKIIFTREYLIAVLHIANVT